MTGPSPDWLDSEPVAEVAPAKRKRTRKSNTKRRAKTRKIEVVSANAIPREAARRFGEGRVWGCDGNYVFYRPRRSINGVWTQVANPLMEERHDRYIRLGHYKYIETQDDVQIFEVTEHSPFKRKFGTLEEMNESTLKRAIIMSAVKREWTVYVDGLEELAYRIKGRRMGDGKPAGQLGADQWSDMLTHIQAMIDLRRGPSADECGRELQRVMRLRNGGGSDKRILLA